MIPLIALLLTIAVPRYLKAASGSGEKARSQNMATIRDALDKFKADQGVYPEKLEALVEKQYLRSVPIDPVTGSQNWALVSEPSRSGPGIYDVLPPGNTPDLAPDLQSQSQETSTVK